MRTTFVSCLVLLTFSSVNNAQSVVYSTDTNGFVYSSTTYDTTATTSSYPTTSTDAALTTGFASTTISTSYTAGTTDGATTTAYPPQSTSLPAIQTVPFTGQALLVGTYVDGTLLLDVRLLMLPQMCHCPVHNINIA